MKRLLLLAVAIITIFYPIYGVSQLYDFASHTFTNAGALGKDGPNLGECQAAYAAEVWELDPALFTMTTQGIQEWTVPVTGTYEIEAAGAQGGNDLYTVNPEDGGLGARMIGTFDLTEGDVLYILVGQKGEDTRVTGIDNAAAGGGGGTFVWDPTDDALPMIASGGGAGGSGFDYAGRNATDAEDGQNAFSFVNGGIGGNGGRLNTGGSSYWAGGGAGWLTNGTGGNQGTLYLYTGSYGQGGRRPLEGGIGGVRFNDGSDEGGDGGFGGGGGGGSDNMGTGGGGGYSGGGGQNGNEFPSMNSGGGGGSYNGGTDQDNTAAINTGNGYVTITLLCNPISVEEFETVLCEGEEIILDGTADSGDDVTWDLGVVNGESFAPPVGVTVYTGSTVNIDDCDFQTTITVNALPVVTASVDDDEICLGEEITFTGGGATSYSWDMGVTDGVAFEPLTAGTVTYTVTGTDDNGCENTTSVDATANALPIVTASVDDDEICLGDEITFTGGGATSYSWDMGVTDGVAFEPLTVGTVTYTVTGTDDNGCENTASVDATVNALPVVTASVDDDEICLGDEITFTGGGATSYSWDMGVTDAVAFEPLTVGTVTYTVTGTDDNGCENTASVDATVNELPAVTASVDDDEICLGDEFTFTGGGATSYSWDMGVTDGAAFEPLTIGTETYTVTGTDDNGCENTASVDATVHALPVVTASVDDDEICFGESVIFTGSGATTYSWDMGVVDGEPFTPLTEGTESYTVTGTDDNGCENTASVDVTVNPELIITYTTIDETDEDGEIDLTVTGGTPGYTFDWDTDEADDFDDPEDLTDLLAGTYTVIVRDASGCEVIEVIEINSLCIPIAIVASELSVCENELLTLSGTAESGEAVIWDGGVTDGVGFLPEMVGIITYTATTDDPADCPSTIDIEVLAAPIVLPTIGGELYCAGDEVVLGAGGDADEYTWSPMDFTPEVGVTTYTLTGTYDDSGCSASETIDVTVYDVPTVNATADLEEVCLGNSITLTGTGAESYVWDPIAIENGTPYTIDEVGTFTYTVVGTDVNGCSDSDEIEITVNEEIEISYVVTEEMIFEDGEINITVTGGVTPYTFDWDIDGTGDFDDDEDLTGLADDLYTVVVNGATGCSAQALIVVGTQASVGEFDGLNFNVYPNPTNDFITVQLDGLFSYVLTDISGKVISTGESQNQEKLSLVELESGLYLLKIKNKDNYGTIQVVKN